MKIFISWSGKRSRATATALRKWLPDVVQAFDPFMSEEDIEKGQRGLDAIATALATTSRGIICMTPENRLNPWIMFEAGAIGKSLDGKVGAVLLDMEPGQLHQAIAQFQATRFAEEDIYRLVASLNDDLAENKLDSERLRRAFDRMWPELERDVKAAAELPPEAAPPRPSLEDIALETLETVRQLAHRSFPMWREMERVDRMLKTLTPREEKVLRMRSGYDGSSQQGLVRLMRMLDPSLDELLKKVEERRSRKKPAKTEAKQKRRRPHSADAPHSPDAGATSNGDVQDF